jgi:hypothetical protein
MEELSFQHKAKDLQFNYSKSNGMTLRLDNLLFKGISFKSRQERERERERERDSTEFRTEPGERA